MKESEISSLAREYAEGIRADILPFFTRPFPTSMEVLIKKDQKYYGQFLEWLLRRYCLVEKNLIKKLFQEHKKESIGLMKGERAWFFYHGRIELLKSLFPEIAKEVEK